MRGNGKSKKVGHRYYDLKFHPVDVHFDGFEPGLGGIVEMRWFMLVNRLTHGGKRNR